MVASSDDHTPFPHPAHRAGLADFRIRRSDKACVIGIYHAAVNRGWFTAAGAEFQESPSR